MLARIVWPKYLLSTYRAFSIHSTSLSSHVFSSISFNKSEHQLFNWALRAFEKRTRTIVKATQYLHSKYVNVCFLLCWPLKCVGVCFVLPLCISLYFLAPNPLIILTDPSPAKIQNQHAHSHIQSEYSALLQPPPWPGLSPGWSQSLQSLAVMHWVAATTMSWGDPGLMELTLGLRLYPDHALPPLFSVQIFC